MATNIDLNELARKLKNQQPIGVDRNGPLQTQNPENRGENPNTNGTTLEPKRFYAGKEASKGASLLFSLEAVAGILAESFRYDHRETGGILLGPKNQPNVITDIIASTEGAERQATTYFQSPADVRALNEQLREFQKQGIDFKGYFHRHPSNFTRLSVGDMQTCKDILRSPNYDIDNRLLMLIITTTQNNDFPIFAYSVSLQRWRIQVKEHSIKVLPGHCILECMECFAPTRVTTQEMTSTANETISIENSDENQGETNHENLHS